jgi:AcrR family transcriptional regulator
MQKKKSAKPSSKPKGGPGRLTAEEAARLPDRLLDAALELFNDQGYAGTSMEQIAKRAGASTKTLYARFADKPAVVEAVVNRIVEASLKAAGATAPGPGRDPRRFLIALGTEIVTNIGQAGVGLIHIALSEGRHSPVITRMYHATLARGRGLLRNALEHWHAAGLLPELKDAEMAAILLLSMLTDMARIRTAMGESMSEKEIAAYIPYATDIFLKGLGYRPGK